MVCLWFSRCSLTLQKAFAPLLLIRLLTTCAGAFLLSSAQRETGQLVPNEQWEETQEGSLTAEGPQAAEEEAALNWARGLLPEEEEGLPPATVLWLTLYLTPNSGITAQPGGSTDWVHLAWVF